MQNKIMPWFYSTDTLYENIMQTSAYVNLNDLNDLNIIANEGILTTIKDKIVAIFKWLWEALKKIYNKLKDLGSKIIELFKKLYNWMKQKVLSFFGKSASIENTTTSSLPEDFSEKIKPLIEYLKSTQISVLKISEENAVYKYLENYAKESIKFVFDTLKAIHMGKDTFDDLVTNLTQGQSATFPIILDKLGILSIKTLPQSVVKFLNNHDSNKVADPVIYMEYLKTINVNIDDLLKITQKDKLFDFFKNLLNSLDKIIVQTSDNFIDTIGKINDNLSNSVPSLVSSLTQKFATQQDIKDRLIQVQRLCTIIITSTNEFGFILTTNLKRKMKLFNDVFKHFEKLFGLIDNKESRVTASQGTKLDNEFKKFTVIATVEGFKCYKSDELGVYLQKLNPNFAGGADLADPNIFNAICCYTWNMTPLDVILVYPMMYNNLSKKDIEIICYHEVGHLKHNDTLINTRAQLIQATLNKENLRAKQIIKNGNDLRLRFLEDAADDNAVKKFGAKAVKDMMVRVTKLFNMDDEWHDRIKRMDKLIAQGK